MTGTLTRVRYVKKDWVAHVTLDRPEVLNAMDLRMHEELGRVWDEIEADDEVRVVVLTGAGDRAFSVGQDLKELAGRVRAGTSTSTFGSRGKPGFPGSRSGSSSPSRSSPGFGVSPWGAASNWPWPATSSSPPRTRCSHCPRRSSV